MRGSGIYQQERDERRECHSERCGGVEQDGVLIIDDWGNGVWVCSVCDEQTDVEPDEPDYDDRDDYDY